MQPFEACCALHINAYNKHYTTCAALSQVKELHGCIEGRQTKIQSFFTSSKQQQQQQLNSTTASSSSGSSSYSGSSSSAVRSSGGVITAADWESDAPSGSYTNGSYTHDSYAATATGTEPLRLLRIRNPWGMYTESYYITCCIRISVCIVCNVCTVQYIAYAVSACTVAGVVHSSVHISNSLRICCWTLADCDLSSDTSLDALHIAVVCVAL
jgi:hypothetical protein